MKQFAFTLNGKFSAVPEGSDIPDNAENIEEFDTVEALHASPAFIAYKAEQDAPDKAAQAAQVIAAGFSLNGKVTPVTDYLYFIQLAQAGKLILESSDITTATVTIPSLSGTYEATLADVNKILAGLETIRSKSLKVESGELVITEILPLEL